MNIHAADAIDNAEPSGESPAYVLLPRAVLRRPPTRHRGDECKSGLTVFELAVAGACAMVARRAAADALRAQALAAGKGAIDSERESLTPAQMRGIAEGGVRVADVIGGAGSGGYWLNRYADVDVEVAISRRQLLRFAGVARSGRAGAMLTPALRRLTRPVGAFAPVLTDLRIGKKVAFVVHAYWLPLNRFAPVPWPPPTKRGGATAAGLWLLLHGADLRRGAATTMRFAVLIERLGMSERCSGEANEKIDAALDIVNRHVRAIGVPGFDILASDDRRRVRVVAERAAKVADAPAPRRDYDDGPTADEVDEIADRCEQAELETAARRDLATRDRLADLRARLRA
jgi:hypothetical protein